VLYYFWRITGVLTKELRIQQVFSGMAAGCFNSNKAGTGGSTPPWVSYFGG
jgi:hypothetical protein